MQGECKFDVVLIRDRKSHGFTAQVLQHDIAAQGKTIEEALEALMFTISAEIARHHQLEKMPFELIKEAPSRYWDLHHQAIDLPFKPQLVEPSMSQSLKNEVPQCESLALVA